MKKRTTKKKRGRKPAVEYVSAAWISKVLGIHASSIEAAWARGELVVAFFVTGGNGKARPVFERANAERWFAERAA